MKKNKKRVRWTLLALLWVWAACMFTVVDLFENVEAFDRFRPESRTYHSMRLAAHKMVGEPYLDHDFGLPESVLENPIVRRQHTVPLQSQRARYLAGELERIRTLRMSELHAMATDADDPRLRIAAMRAMANRFGSLARPVLLQAAANETESAKVRAQAARLVGRTGRGSLPLLEEMLESSVGAVQSGAARGLAELGTPASVQRLLDLAEAGPSPLQAAAVGGVGRISNREAVPVLVEVVQARGEGSVRAAACRALGRSREPAATPALTRVLADGSQPAPVRAAAAHALGLLGQRHALVVVSAACGDASAEISRNARIAKTRLDHVRG